MNLDTLRLTEHPEGGRFREIHRSETPLSLPDGRTRPALTHIYFHLAPGEVSAFHRVEQEEVWNLYRGTALRLWLADETAHTVTSLTLSAAESRFCHVIPPGIWQAAEPMEDEILVGCTVAPGFDFQDFSLLPAAHPLAPLLREKGLQRFLP